MHTDCRHVCARIHRRNGQTVTEIQMCSVCLVHKHFHAMHVCEFCNRTKIGADSIIRRIVDKDRLCIRMTRNCCGDILHAHSECNAEDIVDPGIHIDRNRTAENEGVDCAPMDIARHDDLITAPHRREHHRLYRAGCTAHHEKCVRSAKRLCCQNLRIPNH